MSFHRRMHQDWLDDPEYVEAYFEALQEIVGPDAWQAAVAKVLHQQEKDTAADLGQILEAVRLDGLDSVPEGDRWLWENPASFRRVMEGMLQAKLGYTQQRDLVEVETESGDENRQNREGKSDE